MECTTRIAPGDNLAAALTEGAVICLAPGEHQGPVEIAHSLTVIGEPGAIISGGGRGPAVRILTHKIQVTLQGLTLTDGYAEAGSGLFLDGFAEVLLDDCTIEGNRQGSGPGTGLYVGLGHLTVRGTTFGENDDVVITQIGKATFERSTIQGDMQVTDGAEVQIRGGSIAGTLTVRGTTSRAPTVVLAGVKTGDIANDEQLPGDLTVR